MIDPMLIEEIVLGLGFGVAVVVGLVVAWLDR